MDKPTEYHDPSSCNSCAKQNDYDVIDTLDGHMSECKTKCTVCGFEDYWAYGFYESGQNIKSACSTYSFNK